MSLAPAPGGPRGGPLRHLRAQWVLALLLSGLAAALLSLPLLAIAPNRLVSGRGVPLLALGSGAWLLAPLLLLATAAVARARRALHAACAAVAALWLLSLVAFVGVEATRQAALLPELARISLGGGFWLALWLSWAVHADALRRAAPPRWAATAAHALVLLSLAWLLWSGSLDALSLLKEYDNRQDVFQAALGRHLQIVATTLAAALAIGLPLGLAAARRPRLGAPVFVLLNGVQTVPSIALFGLLIGPLAWLGQAWPGWGLQGIGLLPAVIALTLYALLPIVHGVVSGLQQVPAAAIEAATGMGMTPRQRLWQVELPLALPVLHSALRLTTVQLVGLAVVAALIGAGGLGAIIFQGLLSNALDLVLLGVLPVVALALAIDAAFRLLTPTGQPQ